MKKIMSALLLLTLLLSFAGCGSKNKPKNPLDLIDFDAGTINIDTSEIEQYVKKNGYEKCLFSFDVNKQIYSCEVYLSASEEKKIEIDGEGYESFVSATRSFLAEGTKVMNDVLVQNGLTGISSGMLLVSNLETSKDMVYCVAVDGSITYVAHAQSASVTLNKVKKDIEEIANSVLNDKIAVTINTTEKTVVVFYEGLYNGGSEQTDKTVQAAFDKVKDYITKIGLKDYYLRVGGYDGFPYVEDEKKEDNNNTTTVPATSYNYVGKTFGSEYPVFEIVSTVDDAEAVADLAIKTLKKELNNETFFFYIVDENEKFLGKGGKNGYTPYVFSKYYGSSDVPPFSVPFTYYFSKYFNNIEVAGYDRDDLLTEGGGRMYKFTVDARNIADRAKCQTAANKIVELMSLTIGDEYEIVVQVYAGTDDEIYVSTVKN